MLLGTKLKTHIFICIVKQHPRLLSNRFCNAINPLNVRLIVVTGIMYWVIYSPLCCLFMTSVDQATGVCCFIAKQCNYLPLYSGQNLTSTLLRRLFSSEIRLALLTFMNNVELGNFITCEIRKVITASCE